MTGIAEKPKVTGKDAGGEYCVICEFLMSELEKALGTNATEVSTRLLCHLWVSYERIGKICMIQFNWKDSCIVVNEN